MSDQILGFANPNDTQTPNDFFDDLLKQIDDLSELKITLVALRQTFGYHRDQAELSVSFFEVVTGLSRNSVRRGIELAIQRGTLRQAKESTPRTGAIYEIAHAQAEGQPLTPRGSAVDPQRVSECPSEGQPLTPLKKELNKDQIKEESGAKIAPPTTPVLPIKKEPQTDYLSHCAEHSQRKSKSGIANPLEARKQFAKEIADKLATVQGKGYASKADISAAGQLFDWNIPRDKIIEWCQFHSNGAGEKYRGQTANGATLNAYHINRDIEDWKARDYPPLQLSKQDAKNVFLEQSAEIAKREFESKQRAFARANGWET